MPMYKEEDDSYLKDKRRKDEDENKHSRLQGNLSMKKGVKPSTRTPVLKGKAPKGKTFAGNPKKKAMKSILGSLSSGAGFRNQ